MEQLKKTAKIPYLPVVAGLMVLIPILLAAGCTGNSPSPAGLQPDGTVWTLAGYVSGGTSHQILDGTAITLLFGRDNQISGSAGCNHYFASYELKGLDIRIDRAGSTEMACMAPGVMEQESTYLMLLQQAASVRADDKTLIFSGEDGTAILSFVKTEPPAPEPFAGTNWTLDSFYSGDAVSSVISGTHLTAFFGNDGKITGSAGCNDYFGSYTITGNQLSIGSLGSTKMNCPGRGIMLQESNFITSLGRTAGFSISGNRLYLKDGNGATLFSFIKET